MVVNADLSSGKYKHKVIPSLDIAKFICAVMVVMLHTRPFKDLNLYIDYLTFEYIGRLAVPFFFLTSGYLCFRKTDYEKFDFNIPLKYALKILKLYLLWLLVYSIHFLYETVYKCEEGILHGILLAVRSIIFMGYHHLWYLNALVFAVLFVAAAIKKKFSIRTIFFIGFVLYLLGLLGQSYFFLIKPLKAFPALWELLKVFRNIIFTTRNGLFEGVFFVSIGMIFAYKRIVIKYAYAVVGFIISMIFGFAEVFTVIHYELYLDRVMYLFLIPAVFFMFYIVTHIEINQTKTTNTLRTYSMLIYYTHWAFLPIVNTINKILGKMNGIEDYSIHSLLNFAIVFIGAAAVSKIIIMLSSSEKFKWVRNFY